MDGLGLTGYLKEMDGGWIEKVEGAMMPLVVVMGALALLVAAMAYKTVMELDCDV